MMREGEMSLTTKTITPPQFFTCPISLELFSEPVTLCTGQTYDRFYIEKWFSAGNLTCPVTMQKLHDLSLVPNHTLTHLINQWLQKSENDQIYDDFGRIEEFKRVLESEDCSVQQKIGVLEKVGNFSEYLLRRNVGLFSILLGLIFGEEISEEKMVLVEKSLDCALKLMPFCCMNDDHLSILLLEESKFENFRVLFKDGSVLVKVRLCNFIEVIFTSSSSLSLSQSSQALANKIANDSVLLQTLISSLQDNTAEVSEASIKAILSILSCTKQSYRENMLKEGLINALVTHILEENNSVTHKATKALEMMVELESGKQVLLVTNEVKNTVKALIKMVFRVSGDDECSESAVNCLMKLCCECESTEVREAAICGGVLTQLLLLLQSQCCGRVKTKARLLLKLLRCMWVKDPKQHV